MQIWDASTLPMIWWCEVTIHLENIYTHKIHINNTYIDCCCLHLIFAHNHQNRFLSLMIPPQYVDYYMDYFGIHVVRMIMFVREIPMHRKSQWNPNDHTKIHNNTPTVATLTELRYEKALNPSMDFQTEDKKPTQFETSSSMNISINIHNIYKYVYHNRRIAYTYTKRIEWICSPEFHHALHTWNIVRNPIKYRSMREY